MMDMFYLNKVLTEKLSAVSARKTCSLLECRNFVLVNNQEKKQTKQDGWSALWEIYHLCHHHIR